HTFAESGIGSHQLAVHRRYKGRISISNVGYHKAVIAAYISLPLVTEGAAELVLGVQLRTVLQFVAHTGTGFRDKPSRGCSPERSYQAGPYDTGLHPCAVQVIGRALPHLKIHGTENGNIQQLAPSEG